MAPGNRNSSAGGMASSGQGLPESDKMTDEITHPSRNQVPSGPPRGARHGPPPGARHGPPVPEAVAGALMFARFAYPPNELGLCGPADSGALLERGSAGTDDRGLRHQAQGFEGAWPYLQLIAAANGLTDPLDPRVVEAYWVGNGLLNNVPIAMLGSSLDDRFRRRAARQWEALVAALEVGARPHHNFHVFSVYPWVGLLNAGAADEPLRVLDQCRIRWGQVQAVVSGQAVVASQSLGWEGGSLVLGEPSTETVTWQSAGHAFVQEPRQGDWVAMHWGWLCQTITPTQLQALRRESALQLAIANDRVAKSGPAAVLDS
jgi:hypothetical protein